MKAWNKSPQVVSVRLLLHIPTLLVAVSIYLSSLLCSRYLYSFIYFYFILIYLPGVSSHPNLQPPTQRVCVSAPEAAEFPQHQEDGGDEEGPLFLRPSPRPRSLIAGFTPSHAWSRVRTKANYLPHRLSRGPSQSFICFFFQNLHRKAPGCFINQHAVSTRPSQPSQPSPSRCRPTSPSRLQQFLLFLRHRGAHPSSPGGPSAPASRSSRVGLRSGSLSQRGTLISARDGGGEERLAPLPPRIPLIKKKRRTDQSSSEETIICGGLLLTW